MIASAHPLSHAPCEKKKIIPGKGAESAPPAKRATLDEKPCPKASKEAQPGVVPTSKVTVSDAPPPEMPPDLPEASAAVGAGSKEFLKKLIPWVVHQLPRFLAQHGIISSPTPVASHKPLEIGGGDATLGSYKEVWNLENCRKSVLQTGLYEAVGNVC